MKTRTRAILATAVAFLLLAAAVGAGLNAVFTVTHVQAEFSTCSPAGDEDARRLRTELDAFVGKSTTFLDLDDVAEAVTKYPHFRVERAEKRYPSTVYVSVAERKETFSYLQEDGMYAVLDEEGEFLEAREDNGNRLAGENILLEGLSLTREGGTVQGKYFAELLEIARAFASALGEFRANVVSVSLIGNTSDERNDFLRFRMREGVVIDLGNPALLPALKAEAAIVRYLSLGDEARVFGFITVVDGREEGEVSADYSRDARLD